MNQSTNPTVSPFAGVADRDWRTLVKRGEARGWVSIDDLLRALVSVELSEEIIVQVRDELAHRGIYLDEDDNLDDQPADLTVETAENDVQARLAARRTRLSRPTTRVDGAALGSDPVRMYLKEIGQVELLSASAARAAGVAIFAKVLLAEIDEKIERFLGEAAREKENT